MLELKGTYSKDCIIFNDNIEEEALSLIYNILNTKEFKDTSVRIMPDVHAGKGIVVGFTAPLSDAVNPEHVGVDIGCTIDTWITNADINPEDFALIEYRIKKDIPMGFNINSKRVFEMKDFIKFLKSYFNKAQAAWPEMIEDFDISEKGLSAFMKRIHIDEGVFYKSIGSVGGGNHFIELGDYNGKLAFTIHCGSRNLGQKVCKYWSTIANSQQVDNKIFKEKVKQLKHTVKDRKQIPAMIDALKAEMLEKHASNGYLTGDNMRGYITDMVITTAYALYNHEVIAKKILEILQKINNAKLIERIRSVHNYIDFEDHIIRKGSIRAYEDEKMVVPFNMRDGLAICVGKSNPNWNYSCSHGAGRKLSRSKAKQLISMDEYKETMKDVYSTSVDNSTLDEAPQAYKDKDEILELIKDTCEVLVMVKPLINIKAADENPFSKK